MVSGVGAHGVFISCCYNNGSPRIENHRILSISLVYKKNLILIEVGALMVSGVGAYGVFGSVIKSLFDDWLVMT